MGGPKLQDSCLKNQKKKLMQKKKQKTMSRAPVLWGVLKLPPFPESGPLTLFWFDLPNTGEDMLMKVLFILLLQKNDFMLPHNTLGRL